MADEDLVPPPHSLEAEAAVIALVTIIPDMIRRVAPILRPSDFMSRAHEEIYNACLELHKKGTQPDIVTVADWLRSNDRLEVAGGVGYLTQVINSSPGTANVLQYARIVAGKSNVRKLISACNTIVAKGYTAHGEDNEFLLKAGNEIRNITRIADKSALVTNKEVLRQVFLDIQSASAKGNDISGLKTDIEDYDRLNTGLHGGRLYFVGARPGGGKTARLIQIANAAANQGVACAFFSMEMTSAEICRRQIAMIAKVDSVNLQIGRLSQEEWRRVTEAVGKIAAMPIKLDDHPDLTVNQVRERALGAIEEGAASGHPVGIIVVDYLQRMRVPNEDRRRNTVDVIGDMCLNLKELAKETGTVVVCAVQLKRVPEGRPGKRPTLDDGRGAGNIEQEGDELCFIHRDSQYNKSAKQDEAEFVIVKNRHGPDGIINVGWDGTHTMFTNLKPTY